MKYVVMLALAALVALPASLQAGYHKGHKGDGGFSQMDKDGDGVVSRDEFGDPFARWDENGDGVLDMKEWKMGHGVGHKGYHGKKHGMKGHGKMSHGNVHYPTLEELDVNGDGMLDKEEYATAVPGGGFDMIDTDKSGLLEAKEWESFRAVHMGMGGKKY